ncbi:MAG: HNH endonuclease, partial [Proteobacteria bacterium]|nr:HNH endonuclease [Pseudomonadota bacterium]
MYRPRSWTIEQLTEAVISSTSYRQVLIKLNLRPTGGNYDQLKKYISENQLSVKHFTGKIWNKGMTGIGKPLRPLCEILIRHSYIQSYQLKKRLIKAGLKPNYCEKCGWAKMTIGNYIPVELDHINGDRHDNRIENLRILCPNCHSLTDTY